MKFALPLLVSATLMAHGAGAAGELSTRTIHHTETSKILNALSIKEEKVARIAAGDLRGATPRFSPENLAHNMRLIDLIKTWAASKEAAPAQIALAWLLAQKPWIVPIPGTTVMAHMLENIGAAEVQFTLAELAELNATVRAIEIRGHRRRWRE